MGERYLFPEIPTIVAAQQMSIYLEVSGEPKPGNVTRDRPFADTSYDDFVSAAASIEEPLVSSYEAARQRLESGRDRGGTWGKALLGSCETSTEGRSNTIFGTLLVGIPLGLGATIAARRGDVVGSAERVIRSSSVEDSIAFVRSLRVCEVGGLSHEDLTGAASDYDLRQPDIEERIKRTRMSLHELLSLSAGYDLLAAELTTGFPLVRKSAGRYLGWLRELQDPARACGLVFCTLLSEHPDSLISRKAGRDTAEEVRSRAEKTMALEAFSPEWADAMKALDEFLRGRDLNPGTLADITAASIFLALLGEAC